MEDIKERLGEYKYNFFSNLQKYLDTELYFYGSIKRKDYFSNSSDIDITIITDNINSVLSKAQTYLNIKKSDIKKIYQKLHNSPKSIVKGYKIKYQNKDNNLEFDLLIYDEKYRKTVVENINEINNLPSYLVIIFIILKTIYYNLGLMSKEMYVYLKNALFHMYFSKSFGIYDKKNMSTIILDI
jgi:predicted nucleotidyltransferase